MRQKHSLHMNFDQKKLHSVPLKHYFKTWKSITVEQKTTILRLL